MKKLFFLSLLLFNYTTFAKTKFTTRVNNNIILQDSTLNKWISSFDLSYNHLCSDRAFYFKTPEDKLHNLDGSEDDLEIYQKPNGKYILLDKITKTKIVNQEFDGLEKFGKNRYIVTQRVPKKVLVIPKVATKNIANDTNLTEYGIYRRGIINEKGEIVIPLKYNSIEKVIEGYLSEEESEPQLFKCYSYRKKIQKEPRGPDYEIFTENKYEILDAKGKLITSSINTDIDINFFVNNGKLYTIYQFSDKSLGAIQAFFMICEFGESPKIKYPGKINIGYSDSDLEKYFQNINPLIVTVSNPSGFLRSPYKLFDLGNLNFINGIPEFDKMEIINDKKIVLKNKQNYSSIITSDFKTILPYVPYSLSLISHKNFDFEEKNYDREKFNKINQAVYFDEIIFKIDDDKSTGGRGLFKLGSGVILKPIYLEINEISERYYLIKNKDNTYNIFDILNQKMCLYKNFDRVELVEDRKKVSHEGGYEIDDTWTGFVDCMFEGKTERIQLPK
jgi:hypothetical protein